MQQVHQDYRVDVEINENLDLKNRKLYVIIDWLYSKILTEFLNRLWNVKENILLAYKKLNMF